MNIKRLVKLSVILVLCLFATGVANAETYDGECYYETIVPNFGSFIDELHSEAHIDHTTNTLQYCYNIDYLNGWLYGCVQAACGNPKRDEEMREKSINRR